MNQFTQDGPCYRRHNEILNAWLFGDRLDHIFEQTGLNHTKSKGFKPPATLTSHQIIGECTTVRVCDIVEIPEIRIKDRRFGPGAALIIGSHKNKRVMRTYIQVTFDKEFPRQLNWYKNH